MKQSLVVGLICCLTGLVGLAQQEAGSKAQALGERGVVIIDAHAERPEPPLFFAAESQAKVRLGSGGIEQEIAVEIKILQGRPEVITLGLFGEGDVVSVTGDAVQFWGVRQDNSEESTLRYLEIRPELPAREDGANHERPAMESLRVELVVRQDWDALPEALQLLT